MPNSRKRNHVRAAASIHFINGIDPKRTWQTHAIKPSAGGWLEAALRVLGWSAAFNSPLQRFRAISPEHLAGVFL
jgi:hypothetical protein